MKKIVLFDPAQGSLNAGDFIIRECLDYEMDFLLRDQCVVRYSTHQPISRGYQAFRKNLIRRTCNGADYRFLCGTNLFKNSLLRLSPDWNINHSSCDYYRGSIAVGCGMDMNAKHSDFYTRYIYRQILSREYIHSVRDERTREYLESLGFRAVNTGCPSMWALTPQRCAAIPREKKDCVIFTLTDYCRDETRDRELVQILRRNYRKISFWVQGYHDYDYLKTLTDPKDLEILPHSLEAFREALGKDDTEYVGTRLHAGIYAMRHGVRSIIVGVDNRAQDLNRSFELPLICRSRIGTDLEQKLLSSFATELSVPLENIALWKGQFAQP